MPNFRANECPQDTPLSASEYDLLVQFVKSSMRPLAQPPDAEQELLTSLAFALRRNARGC